MVLLSRISSSVASLSFSSSELTIPSKLLDFMQGHPPQGPKKTFCDQEGERGEKQARTSSAQNKNCSEGLFDKIFSCDCEFKFRKLTSPI